MKKGCRAVEYAPEMVYNKTVLTWNKAKNATGTGAATVTAATEDGKVSALGAFYTGHKMISGNKKIKNNKEKMTETEE